MTKFGVLLLVLAFLIPAATAATVTISPASIDPGDTVTVDVSDLPDGAAFSLEIRGEFAVVPGEQFAFTARNLALPFSLGSGEVSAYSKGTEWTGLSVQMLDGSSVSLSNSADANGEFQTTQSHTISNGTYPAITLDGRAAPTARSVVTRVTMQGTKTGPDTSRITFGIEGITHGTATVTISINGSQTLSRTIAIGSASSSDSDSSSDSSGGSSSTPTPTPGPATAASADGKASLTGTDLGGAGLLAVTVQGAEPAGWSLEGRAYAVTPEGREFDPAVVLSFSLPSADTAATLARYEDGAWVLIPSKIEGDRITAAISRAGSYALFAPVTAPDEPVATTTATTAATSATPTPTATPVAPLLPVIALAMVIFRWRGRS